MSTNPSAHLDGAEVARLVGDLCAALFADLDGIATEAGEQLAVASPEWRRTSPSRRGATRC